MIEILKLDWDDEPKIDNLARAMKRIKILVKVYGIFPKFFKTENGFHIELLLPTPITPELSFNLRKIWHDDCRRIDLDKMRYARGEPFDILFADKNGHRREPIFLAIDDFK